MLPKIVDGKLDLTEAPIYRKDGTFLLCDGLFHVDKTHELWPALDALHKEKPRLFIQEPENGGMSIDRALAVRRIRNEKLKATDFVFLEDCPLGESEKEKYRAYRQALRDITMMDGFPWDGGGAETPWPKI